MKAVGYALTISVVVATYLCRDDHKQYLDGCYAQRPAGSPTPAFPEDDLGGGGLLDRSVEALAATATPGGGDDGEDESEEQGLDVDAQIHWASGLPCFLTFYTGQLMLALAYRQPPLGQSATASGHGPTLAWRIALEAVGGHAFRVLVYVWLVLPMGLQMENYA